MNDSNTEKKGFFQRIADKFKSTSEKVADKVEDTISDVKNSEFAGKVTETAQNISAKAKDMVQDVKDSEIVDKVGDAAKDLAERAKKFGGKVLEKLGSVAGIPSLKNAGEKLRATPEDTTVKEDQLDELDKFVAVILEDGVITPEEETLLTQKAESLGLDVQAFLAEVRERCTPKE
ncbi:MAG: hypothetical protein J6T86_07295 [Bacteroidales bacterium]|nr:hypothetical protein [Bacteroidales bacterium]